MRQATHFTVQPGWNLMLCDMGVNPEHVLRLAGLPAGLFARKEASITSGQYFRLWQAVEDAVGASTLPLLIGQAISVEAFDPPIFAALCSPNLNSGMRRLSAFKRLVCPMVLTVDVGPKGTAITLECYGNEGNIPRSMAISELVFITQLVRLGTRRHVIPLEVLVPEVPDALGPYIDYFGVPPKAGSAIRISFSSDDAGRPFLTANESLWAYFEPELRKKIRLLDSTAPMHARVKAVLLEGLPAGESSMEYVANQLAVSKRTLQRQLKGESTSFNDILIATRKQLALHYLCKPALSQGEIAFLLGFQEVNSFIRAFKDWTGQTPGAYRQGTFC